jgi:type VI secretion system protein VasG
VNIPRRSLFGKLNTSLFKAVESATAFAKLRGNPYVELVHWLHQLRQLPDSDFSRVINRSGINAAQLDQDFVRFLDRLPSGASGISDFGYRIELAIEKAWVIASLKFGQSCVRGASLLVAIGSVPELKAALVEISPQFELIYKTQFQDQIYAAVQGSTEDGDHAYDQSGFDAAIPGETSQAISQAEEQSVLSKYCSDLTANARDGKVDPVIGRDEEVRTMIDILLRRRQNNPLLTGEAGVGKTAVVEGLALAIAQDKVPPSLRHVRLLSLDIGALLAGASMRGEFEARLKSVLQEAADSECPVILFIDEVHTLVGAGGQAGTGDAANLLKPALARGGLRSIGATTWSEFKKHIEKDPALTRRFQVLQIGEPDVTQAISMVRGLVSTFSRHHDVVVMDAAVTAAVTLSHRYIPARQLPDKAISLLDTACARVAMSLHMPSKEIVRLNQEIQDQRNLEINQISEAACDERIVPQLKSTQQKIKALEANLEKEKINSEQERRIVKELLTLREKLQESQNSESLESQPIELRNQLRALETQLSELQKNGAAIYPVVSESVVAAIVSDWTGIPVGRMVKDDVRVVQELAHILEQRVVGQSQAIRTIAERVKTAKSKLTNPTKPIGTFLLVGPSGVGKTETALALAQAIYGGEYNLITINMSEYQEAHTVSSLKGSPPGYVGYGEGGVLTEAVRRRPYSVVLLDEVEKAHPDVHELFYQVFDKGWMEDGEGRVIDFKNTLILLTSNTGADLIAQLCDDRDLMPSDDVLRDSLSVELRKVFPAAFLGRLSVVPYMPLDESVLMSIAAMQLDQVVERVKEQHCAVLSYSEQVLQHMVDMCGKHETGARRIGQFIEQNILAQLAQAWLDSMQNETPYKFLSLRVSQPSSSDFESTNRYQKSGIELVLQDDEPITN